MTIKYSEISDFSSKLKKGSLGIFPTDTLPAICSCPDHAEKIWEIKKRSLNKPLILMGGCLADLFELVDTSAVEDGIKIAKIYWPGALTIVLPTTGNISKYLNSNSNSLGLRVPDLRLARELLLETGPLATTSANISGKKPVRNSLEASIEFPGVPILGPAPWPNSSGIGSTIVEWEEGKWNLLRSGSVVFKELN